MKCAPTYQPSEKKTLLTIGAKVITHTTFIVGELLVQLRAHTHISYTTLIVEEFVYVMRVYLWCLSVLPLLYYRKANDTTIMVGELISNCTHTSYTTIIVGELIV